MTRQERVLYVLGSLDFVSYQRSETILKHVVTVLSVLVVFSWFFPSQVLTLVGNIIFTIGFLAIGLVLFFGSEAIDKNANDRRVFPLIIKKIMAAFLILGSFMFFSPMNALDAAKTLINPERVIEIEGLALNDCEMPQCSFVGSFVDIEIDNQDVISVQCRFGCEIIKNKSYQLLLTPDTYIVLRETEL